LLFGFRLWASVCLALYIAFALELDNAFWAATSAAIVCQPQLGASLRKGWFRMVGTVIGAVAIVLLSAVFPQARAPFLISLAAWVAVCAFGATMLRNFASYAAALSGYTAAIIASDTLGATGGTNGQAFTLAVYRVSEICMGIACAGVVLAGTDLGGAPRRLAGMLAMLSSDVMRGYVRTLMRTGPDRIATQEIQREFIRQVIALDGVIDEAIGESSRLRSHSPVLRAAMDGLFTSLEAWRATNLRLAAQPLASAGPEADAVLEAMLPETRRLDEPRSAWAADPVRRLGICDEAARQLLALPAETPSRRLLADQAARVFTGLSPVFGGLALLVADPSRRAIPYRRVSLRLPDWLPAVVDAGRTFVVVIALSLFWIVTAWPNGAIAITFGAIVASLLSPRADQAYGSALLFMYGTAVSVALAATVDFALLPQLRTFAGLSLAVGLVLVPAGALMAQPWRTPIFFAVTLTFIPVLVPTNQEQYDPVQFYNNALGIFVGIAAATLSFRLIPPLSPAFRTRRLLALTLREVRRLALGGVVSDWEGRIYARLMQMPEQATPLQRGQLLAALSVGREIILLRRHAGPFGVGVEVDAVLVPLAQGQSATALAALSRLDERLAVPADHGPAEPEVLRARSRVLAMAELLTRYADYFDGGAPA
jgi:uncharacterized membrane protein YccC